MSDAIIFDLPAKSLDDFRRLDGASNVGLTFEKELIYTGAFVQSDQKKFAVKLAELKHWAEKINEFSQLGIKIPLPIGHTFDPERSRGELLAAYTSKDTKGRDALFGVLQFRDAEAAKVALTTDVSIYAPLKWQDGLGNVHENPITHVALTDYPVVPDLDGFEAIVASLDASKTPPPKQEPKNMGIKALAKTLKLEFDEKDDDDKIAAAIAKKFEAMWKDDEETKAELKKLKAELEKAALDEDEEGETEASKKQPVSAALVEMTAENRGLKIDRLLEAGKVTPAVAKSLKERFCKPEALALSLQDSQVGGDPDGFKSTFEMFEANEPVISFSSQSSYQLSTGGGGETLEQSAERRAKATNGS